MARIFVVASLASSLLRFRGELIRALREKGHEVYGVAPHADPATARGLDELGVRFIGIALARTGMNPFADWVYLRTLRRLFVLHRPDVVLAYTPKPVIYCGLACRKMPSLRFYALITGLGYGFGSETWRQRAITPLLRQLFKRGLSGCDCVIFQNPDDRRLFVERDIVRSDRTALVCSSGVDLDRFGVAPLPAAPVFLLMARLIPEKGVREYVDAARRLRKEMGGVRCLLAGWIEKRRGAISIREVDEWQREGVVEYLGALDDVRDAIASAGVYVLPSYYREGVPRSVLEAMAMGRAVITTNLPGCRETVVDGVNGLLVSPRDSRTLAHCMKRLAGDPSEVARMGAASRRMAQERFGLDQINKQMIDVMGMAE